MTAILDLTPMILPFVRDCSAPAALVAARFACMEFYRTTLWQQEMLEPVDLVATQSIYEIETPPDTVPSAVMRIELGDHSRALMPKTKDELDQLYGTRWTTLLGTPVYFTQVSPHDVILVPGPDTSSLGAMRLLVAVQPTPDAIEIDDSVFDYYAEVLAYGARARLVETAGQPYYDPASAPMLVGAVLRRLQRGQGATCMREHTPAVQHVQLRKWI